MPVLWETAAPQAVGRAWETIAESWEEARLKPRDAEGAAESAWRAGPRSLWIWCGAGALTRLLRARSG